MKTTASVKLDTDVKKQAAGLAADLGLSLSAVVNAMLKQFIDERRITFSKVPKFNPKMAKEIRALRRDVRQGENLVGPFDSSSALKASLLK